MEMFKFYFLASFLFFIVFASKNDKKRENKRGDKNKCDRNKTKVECMSKNKTSRKIKREYKSRMPDYVEKIQSETEEFSKLSSEEQKKYLNDIKQNIKENYSEGNKKEGFELKIKLSSYLTQRDCSNSEDFNKCREEKKEILHEILLDFKKNFPLDSFFEFLKNSEIYSTEEYLKNILLLFLEISSNTDSLSKGDDIILYEYGFFFKENIKEIYENIQKSLLNPTDTEILNIKSDIKKIIALILTHLLDITHYEEADGYLKEKKNKYGLIITNYTKKAKKETEDIIRLFLEDGPGEYDLDYINTIIEEYNINPLLSKYETEDTLKRNLKGKIFLKSLSETEETEIKEFPDYGITVIIPNGKLFNKYSSYYGGYLEVSVYDNYPFMSIEDDQVVKSFVSLKLYKKTGEQVEVINSNMDNLPEILFEKKEGISYNYCYYYDEKTESLLMDGLLLESRTIDGIEYAVCKTTHLTDFTVGEIKKSSATKTITLIIFLFILFIIMLIIYVNLLKKKQNKKEEEVSQKNSQIFEMK